LSSWALSAGNADLYVTPLGWAERMPPTPEQVAAFRHLLDHEASVAAAVERALLGYYPGARARNLDAFGGDSLIIEEESERMPEVITDVAGLVPLIGLSAVHVLAEARDGIAYVGFEFGCEWDEEHGAGVMTHRGRIVAVGQADVSSGKWVARRDIKDSG
jgi:hypothetical protein